MPGHLLWVLGGVRQGVRAADGVSDQDVGALFAGRGQQLVQVSGGGDAVLGGAQRRCSSPVPRGRRHTRASCCPTCSVIRAQLAEISPIPLNSTTVGAAVAAAVQVQTVVAHLVGLAGGGVGVVVAHQRDVLDGGADARGREHDQDRRHQPAAPAGQGTAHLHEHPDHERQHQRGPDPVDRSEGGIRGGDDQEAEAGCAHSDCGNAGPALGLAGHPCGQDGHHGPAEPESEEHRAGDDGLGGAGEDHQREEQSRHGSRGDGTSDHAGHRHPPALRGRVGVLASGVGSGLYPHGGLALAVVVWHCSRAWTGTALLTPVRWPGCAG